MGLKMHLMGGKRVTKVFKGFNKLTQVGQERKLTFDCLGGRFNRLTSPANAKVMFTGE